VESDWSSIITVDFPTDLNTIMNQSDMILMTANKEDIKASLNTDLASRGLDEHLSNQLTVNNIIYHHDTKKILSGFQDSNGVSLDLYEYLRFMEDRIRGLEEKIKRAKGELSIIILRNNQEFIVNNGSETIFNIECEDYLNVFTGQGVPTGRVYENNIYVIKDFVVKFTNKSSESLLGLLSNRNYLQADSMVYNSEAPQTFWVNNQDELITSDTDAGQTRTQLDNQFIWMTNYDSIAKNTVSKLSENIGNSFNRNNSITSVLSSSEYNIGYNELNTLNFMGNNKSLLEPLKWIDNTVSVTSTSKFLSSIHPVVKDLESITETNTDRVKSIRPGDSNSVIIPLNIYFKSNSLDTTQNGLNYQYINLNNSTKTTKHVKKIKFS
jgi:hypothetical protein